MLKSIIAVIIVCIVLCAYPAAYYGSKDTTTVTVDEKWRKEKGGDEKYLFSDTDGNVYSIQDSLLLLKFRASDRYAFIKEGSTYQITTYSWRIGFLSMYKNAIKIEHVSD